MVTGPETDVIIHVDGAQPPTAELVERVARACDAAEGRPGGLVVHVSGVPGPGWADGLTVSLVSRWERALRRLERLPAATVAVAEGPCGGTALDALLAADHRIASPSVSLVLSAGGGPTWPGMAVFRLAQQGQGGAAVRRAVLFGDPVSAFDALALQLVDRVTDDVATALADAARRAASVDGAELAVRRQLLLDARTVPFEEALGVHLAACDRRLRQASVGVLP